MRAYLLTGLFLFGLLPLPISNAQDAEMEKTLRDAGAEVEVYKNTIDSKGNEANLNLYIFKPANHKATDQRAAIVFFFGGGWNGGKPSQFTEHCKYLASRGMVAVTADYRVASRQGTKAIACVSDGKSAVRWIRQNAERLGVDPEKVAAGGGSAGGHVAACTGVVKTLDEAEEDANISSAPNAMVLFNPVLVLAPVEGKPFNEKKMAGLKRRVGADPKSISPFHQVAAGNPPTIVFHGKADTTVPYLAAEIFTEAMTEAGNECELVGFEDQGHGFFNHGRKNGKFDDTVKAMDDFLVSLGFIAEKEEKE